MEFNILKSRFYGYYYENYTRVNFLYNNWATSLPLKRPCFIVE
jgi:hypothetical protein